MNPLIRKLEERILPEFERVAVKIREQFSEVSVSVESHSVGSDEFLGHGYCISALLNNNLADETDLVDLCVSLSHLVTIPKIDACVCWGHPSGCVEAEFPDFVEGSANNSLVVSDEALEDLYEDLPRLYEALFRALNRRKPGNE